MFSPKNEKMIETVISNKSKNETVIEILNKVQSLKQNHISQPLRFGTLELPSLNKYGTQFLAVAYLLSEEANFND